MASATSAMGLWLKQTRGDGNESTPAGWRYRTTYILLAVTDEPDAWWRGKDVPDFVTPFLPSCSFRPPGVLHSNVVGLGSWKLECQSALAMHHS